jgi:hypothetical protein
MDACRGAVLREYLKTGRLDLISPTNNKEFVRMLNQTPPRRNKRDRDRLIGILPSPRKPENEPLRKKQKVDDFIGGLPPEVWFRIFWHLEFFDLARCREICRVFRDICTDDHLWKVHYLRLFFGDPVVPIHPWPVTLRTCRMDLRMKRVTCGNPTHFIITNDRHRPKYTKNFFWRTAERFFNLGTRSINRRIKELSWKSQTVFRTEDEKKLLTMDLEEERRELKKRYQYVLDRLYPK